MPKKQTESVEKPQEEKEMPAEAAVSYYEAVGRRRVATARVRLYVNADNITVSGNALVKGAVSVNGKSSDEYFPGDVSKRNLLEPFRTTNTLNRFAVSVKTRGGGLQGQLGAVILGISRALLKVDLEKFRPILKKRGFLTRDPRAKQRRKAGFAHKARARKQSPKR